MFKARNATATDVVIEIDEAGKKVRFTADGAPIDDTKFKLLLAAMKDRQLSHAHAALVESPHPSRPLPIFLEHTDLVVGWGRVEVADGALLVRDAYITDDETLSKIHNGVLTGFSIGGLVREAECSICRNSYFECAHIGREIYKGDVCRVNLTNVDLAEISIVKDPVNPEAVIRWQGKP